MRDPNEIITSQIPRAELAGLLDTMAPGDAQKVTAEHEIPVVTIEEHKEAKRKRADTAGERPTTRAKKRRDTTGNLDVVVRFAPSSTGSHPSLPIPAERRGARITDAIRAMTPADVAVDAATERPTVQMSPLDASRLASRATARISGAYDALEKARATGPHQPLPFAASRTSGIEPPVLLPTPSAVIAPDRPPLPRWAIVAVSAGITLFLALLIALVA